MFNSRNQVDTQWRGDAGSIIIISEGKWLNPYMTAMLNCLASIKVHQELVLKDNVEYYYTLWLFWGGGVGSACMGWSIFYFVKFEGGISNEGVIS